MPNFGLTPEALLGRNDSKNPATTCKGMTGSGRPCRRALPAAKLTISKHSCKGVIYQDPADYYCWQHKDQAVETVNNPPPSGKPGRFANRVDEGLPPLQERTSIDTLVQRLGINSSPVIQEQSHFRPSDNRRPRPNQYQDPNKPNSSQAPHAEKYGLGHAPPRKTQRPGFWRSLCCVVDDDDYVEIVRHRKRVNQSQHTNAPTPSQMTKPPPTTLPIRQRHDSETNQLLSLIPPTLTPQTASVLLAELTKPISPTDEEGYIYIFWLTPQSKQTPPTETARSLLLPSRPTHERRLSDVMSEFSAAADESTPRKKNTIMLKIGRANNVTRRMNEWQRQCGYALNLVRWYPHVPSASNNPSPTRPSPARSPIKTPHYHDLMRPSTGRHDSEVCKVPSVKRVERLIHLELAEKRVMKHCKACHKEHREWFEVEASQGGVREVDECVRRWIGWAERNEGKA